MLEFLELGEIITKLLVMASVIGLEQNYLYLQNCISSP